MNLLFSILLTVGLVLVAVSLVLAVNEHLYISRGTVAEGSVVENLRRGKGYSPKIRFRTYQGREVDFMPTFTSNPPAYQVGDKLRVVYQGDGAGARILSFALRFGAAWPLFCAGLALVLVAFGFKYGDALVISHYAGSALPSRF